MTESAKIIVLLGPTASGKTALALSLAEKIGAEILSVDSMQVYRKMDLGTAKPSQEEQSRVKHHLIDLIDPTESYAVSQFVEQADAIIADAAKRNVPLIATGGTPMYYKALFEGLFEGPGADDAIRARLNEEPLETLHARLTEVDPTASQRIHMNDRRRLVRALEVYELTGKPISSFQTDWESGQLRHQAKWFGLNWEKDELNRRINLRSKLMLQSGWLEEARSLLTEFGTLSKTAYEATGYHELFEHIEGRISLEDACEQIKIATRQLARRQMKWFRRWNQIKWLDGKAGTEENMTLILDQA